ncbi:MAG: FAD binding domain-containing protein [Anaerolineales bacterium]|nr:FAD binding domain-containing protein [Anaerolineales bacterium]
MRAQYQDRARIIAGGTDLLLEIERGVRHAPDGSPIGVIDLTRIPGLADIWTEGDVIHLGPLVTHNQCVASPIIVEQAFPLARACWEVGAPQIRNRATVAGNVITASPANDTIVPLLALDAQVTVASAARGERTLPLVRFLTGMRRVDLAADEILTRITLPALPPNRRGVFIKLGLRRAQAISLVSVCVVVGVQPGAAVVEEAAISLGAVAPIIVRAYAAEEFLKGKPLESFVIAEAARRAVDAASPIDDIRGAAAYRRSMVETLVARALVQIAAGEERRGWPAQPVLLWGEATGQWPAPAPATALAADEALVNGHAVRLPGGMSLLDALRQTGFAGVKEGCAEGECGACTVFLDGMAIMACVTPAERAWGSACTTIEGLSDGRQLHPVQAALVQSGGVQCGYCTPGFVMSAAKLLEERPNPSYGEAQEAFTGNFCRCTGYQKILDAVLMAGQARGAR